MTGNSYGTVSPKFYLNVGQVMDEMNFFTVTPGESLQAFNFCTTTEASNVSTQQ